MKICVTATDRGLDASVDPFFGRCRYFIIVDSETMEFEALQNPSASAPGGAGVQAAQAIANKGINVLLTGDIGPNASPILSNANIKMVTGTSGTVKDAIEQYKKGALKPTTVPTMPAYFGMGRGRGRGMGRGRGFWCRWYPHPVPYYMPEPYIPYEVPYTELSREEEIAHIKEIVESLEDELKDVRERLKELSEEAK
ncbi:NifB/NifX family molybdenum-iron cluster-binding protein [Methanococcoides methylutens]|uniref:NifB/NifX family molybdenum-iron cluster-binding protein n=1 Tax=Methanococcoides methylutens TaxID=2226 RepID=UPI0040451448